MAAWNPFRSASRPAVTGDGDHGAIAIIAVAMMFIIFGLMALSVDTGFLFMRERNLQAAVDAAAMAAVTAADEDEADERVATLLGLNDVPDYTITVLERGGYTESTDLAIGERFDPDAGTINALRLGVAVSEPTFIARFFGAGGERALSASAVAHTASIGGLAISAPSLSVEVNLANALLSGQTDASINLSANDYRALQQVQVNVYDVLDSLAGQTALDDATYEEVADSTVDLYTFATALMEAVDEIPADDLTGWESRSRSALDDFRDEVDDGDGTVRLSDVMSFDNAVGRRQVGSSSGLTAIDVPLYNLVLMGNAAGTSAAVELGPVLGLDDVVEESVHIAIGAAAGEPWLVIGEAGARVRSPGVRILVETEVLANLGNFLGWQLLSIPVTIELGVNEAVLDAVHCGRDPEEVFLDVDAAVGLSQLLIADIDPSDLSAFSSDLPTSPAILLNILGLAGITASVNAELTSATFAELSITGEEIDDHEILTVIGDTMRGNLVSNAQSSLDIDVNLWWISVNVPGGIRGLVNGVLSQIGQDLDAIYSVLPGISIGRMDLMGLGVSCRTTLVQ